MILCAVTLVLAQGARAADSPAYFGVKAGAMLPDIDDMDALSNAGMTLGYGRGAFAAEAELTTTISPGETGLSGVQWDITTLALYAVYRSPGTVYLKAKAGALHEKVTFDAAGVSLQDDDSGVSWGLGVGFERGNASRVELEYTVIDSDVAFLSLGYLF